MLRACRPLIPLVVAETLVALLCPPQANTNPRARGPMNAVAVTFPFNEIAQIAPAGANILTFGDTDHDGRNEVILSWLDDNSYCCFYRILEEQGSNVYSEEYRSGYDLFPFSTGDLDRDGKAEIIGQHSYWLQVFESIDAASYPTQLVWTSPALSNNLGRTSVADTDRDGRMEIIHNLGSWMIIYENTGDNSYEQVYLGPTVGGEHTIADLDGDGLIEIGSVGGYRVRVFESPADNTWVQTWSDSTELWGSGSSEGGRDTDGNGKPELFVMGNASVGGSAWTTIVYEATGDNQFTRVATLALPEAGSGVTYNELANLDGLGAEEYLMQGLCCLWIYQAVAPGQWALIQEITDPDGQHHGLHAFDVNRNGRPELFWDTDALFSQTLVLEYPFGVSGAEPQIPGRTTSLSILPNPCQVEARLHVQVTVADAAVLAVYDVAGRLVERRVLVRDERGQILWPVRHLSAGIYFLHLENRSGARLASGRGTVVR